MNKVVGVVQNINYTKVKQDKEDCGDGGDEVIPFQAGAQDHLPFFQDTQVLRCVRVYLDEEIKAPKYYRTLLQAAESLSEGDVLHISVNSYGGHLDGALAIIQAMKNTEAHVQVAIDGAAASAAGLIALASPNLLISEYATMMIHAASFGSFGKQGDVLSHAGFVDRRIKAIMQDVYRDFLSEDELKDVLMGREIWLDADEIVERLQARKEKQERKQREAERELQKAMKAAKAPAKPDKAAAKPKAKTTAKAKALPQTERQAKTPRKLPAGKAGETGEKVPSGLSHFGEEAL